jgi:hypothetical protein
MQQDDKAAQNSILIGQIRLLLRYTTDAIHIPDRRGDSVANYSVALVRILKSEETIIDGGGTGFSSQILPYVQQMDMMRIKGIRVTGTVMIPSESECLLSRTRRK